jgi:RNA polymerase sigma-70 factor (ECF subfamily)
MKHFQIKSVLLIVGKGGSSMTIDKSIIQRCKKNDKNAFAELFKFYQNYLFKLCYSYVQNEQEALDLMQEIYIKLYKNINKYDDKYPFHPWIRKVSVNTCLNQKRKQVCIISLSENEENLSLEDQLAAEEDTQREVENHDMARIIKQHIYCLPEKQRMVIILRYYEDLSYDEISELLSIPLGTVKTDLYRAKKALKDRLYQVMST